MITTIFVVHVVSSVVHLLDQCACAHGKRVDEATYDYCLNRVLVICPNCRVGFEVTCVEEQFNMEWACACCGASFREYPTHTRRLP